MADESKPIFMKIMNVIEDNILSEEYKTHDIIISTTQISKIFSVNPSTAVRAVSELTTAGLLYKKRGIGMCVAEGAKEKISEQRIDLFFNKTLPSFFEEANKLRIPVSRLIEILKEKEQ